MLPTLRRLLHRPELSLRLVTPQIELPSVALDTPIEWAHSSDLLDPTPFLSPGQMLLTTGTQFSSPGITDADYAAYVGRLKHHGLSGLGFGTEVIRDGTPAPLKAACLQHGLPLVEVPYRVPFIAVARTIGDMVAEERYARSTWALRAQRAISLAALRPDGLSAILGELSRQLQHWVALFDARGTLTRVFPTDAFDAAATTSVRRSFDMVEREAGALLRRGQRASSLVAIDGETLTLQTLGSRDHLRGVLALGGSAQLDRASQEVVTSVVALAGLALEQNNALDTARGHLRSGLWRTLLGGDTDLVASICEEMWGALPTPPVRIGVTVPSDTRISRITEYLELQVADHPGQLFFARDDTELILCLRAGGERLFSDLCVRFDLHGGLSDSTDYRSLHRAISEARRARDRSVEGTVGVVEFDTVSRQGVLAFLARTDARDIARATLAPVQGYDQVHGSDLLLTLSAWLENNAEFAATATLLGVHRHTVRSRIRQAEAVLGRDLSTFPARADIWAALLAAGPASP